LFDRLHIVLQLGLSGAIPLLPLYASMTYGYTDTHRHTNIWTHTHTDIYGHKDIYGHTDTRT